MRIALDGRAWNWTGVGRYIRNLCSELMQNSGEHTYTLLVPYGEVEKIREELSDHDSVFRYVEVEPSYYSLREQTVFLYQLYKLRVDLVHFMHFNVPLFYKRPFIVTTHDVTRFIFPGQKRQSFLQQIAYEKVFAHAVSCARTVIAVSKTTALDMALLPVVPKREAVVMYEGIDERFRAPVSQEARASAREYMGVHNKYVLFVGVWMSHKNLFRLLEAFRIVHAKQPNVSLVITGKPEQGYSDLVKYVHENKLGKSIVFPGFIPHGMLPAVYAEATAMAFPSLYEGFGLPPLEAAACGTPVVASNVSAMPELLFGCAEFVNPESVDDIARGILRVVEDSTYALSLARGGIDNAQKYQIADMAVKHIRAYENALQ